MQRNRIHHWPAFLIIVTILILSGCSPAAPTTPPEPIIDANVPVTGPTVVEPTVAVQATETQSGSTQPEFRADLSVVESTGRVLKSTDVQQDQTVGVQISDQIEMAPESRSFLNVSDFLEVEIFRNAKVLLADVQQESGGSTDVTLKLSQGHIFVRLEDAAASSRVTVETPYAIIRAREDGTDFDICHNEVLTCVLIKKGVAEVIGQDQKVIIRGGEASYIMKDQPPTPAICAPLEIFNTWEEDYRASAQAPLLGKVVSELPQEPCPGTTLELPSEAHIVFRDDFTDLSMEWPQTQINNYVFGYAGTEHYQVQILSPSDKFPVSVPNKTNYGDINIDLAVVTEAASAGEFRYGMVFRRSGGQYYAFTISPRTKTWHVLKSSSGGEEILNEGTEDSIQGLLAKDVLRVEAKGSAFSLYINGRQVGQVNDPDYVSGEVGLYVQTLDSPEARINFDSIIIWETSSILNPTQVGRELCFNSKDDDGDRLIDREDPDCERPDALPTDPPPTDPPPTDPPPTDPPPTDPPLPPTDPPTPP
jgi:hypothetical protein